MLCAKCNYDNPADAMFCMKCGTKVENRCASCNTVNPADANFCRKCGKAVGAGASAPSPSPTTAAKTPRVEVTDARQSAEGLDGERKTVTALFADIKGSTELEQDLDPEEARAIVDPALKLMIDAVRRYDGYIVQSTGDGIFALFGAPVAHEDHPQRALYAALRMQEEMKRYSARVVADGGMPVEARVGVNTGEVVVRSISTGGGHVEYTPIGHTTNLASRMQAVAPTGSIATSEQTRKFCEGYFTLKPMGPTRVKGVSEPVNVYEVTGLGPLRTRLQRSAGRGLSKFVGREREMASMQAAAERAKSGRGQIVAAMAEAGTGKSRLILEFKAVSQSGWMVLETFSVSHGKASAFLPVIDLLWGYFEITSDDDERKRREKINGKVLTLDRSLEDALPYLHAMLGLSDPNSPVAEMDPQARKRRSLDAIKRILLRESLNQPLIVIFEDLHWVDDESQVFLNLLADSIANAKILLLVNYRPEYSHQWGSKTFYTQLRLDPLGKENADEMLTALVGDSADVRPLKRLIIERTEGNPFFMEETVQVLLDEGALVRDGATARLTKPLGELKIPPTVQAILAARIDRLLSAEKDLLQALAVMGKEFQLSLVRTVSARSDDELNRLLETLQLAEFIYEQPAVGDVEYSFKHALTQDVAYNSVLIERRKSLHERIGAALESIYADSLDDHIAELAHHYARSGNPAKGAQYCLLAVEQFSDRGSNAEAVARMEAGLELLQKLPDDDRRAELELDLRIAGSYALRAIKGWGSPELEQSSSRAVALCERPGIAWEKTSFALQAVLFVVMSRPDVRKAREMGAELLARAEENGIAERTAGIAAALALSVMYSGDFERAAELFDRSSEQQKSILEPATAHASQRPRTTRQPPQLQATYIASAASAWNIWFLGYPDRALERVTLATDIANKSGSKVVLELVLNLAKYPLALRREFAPMREVTEAALALSIESGTVTRKALCEMWLGWADALAGDLDGGIARMRRSLSEHRAAGSELISDYVLALIATALGEMGRFEEALRTIDESFQIIERTGQRMNEAEVHRLKGELLLAQDASNAAQAEQSFRTAIDISRKQHAKSWELRATTSLARLLDKQGNRDEARAMLSEIYNWFTEGFDTADLKDAKALLDQLSE
jgi:class 3 adenylate cyclase/tetratricopeptide (TPR) repeat protein/ribosomal protein L40E